jgi:hypothetical protein
MGKSVDYCGYGGIYTPTSKPSRWSKRFPETPDKCPDTPDTVVRTLQTQRKLLTVNRYPVTPGICSDTPDFVSGHSGPGASGLTKDTLKNIISKWFLWLTSICMGSLEY